MRRCEGLDIAGTRRGRGRLKKYWEEVIRHDMVQLQVTEQMTSDRSMWRACTRVTVQDY